MIDYSKQGKSNKKAGYYFEDKVAKLFKERIDEISFARPTPRSGAIWVTGDICIRGSEFEKYNMECKYGNQVPLKIYHWYNKLKSEGNSRSLLIVQRKNEDILILQSLEQYLRRINECICHQK